MNDDRQLLELAAKAAGIEIEYTPAATENIGGSLRKFRVTSWHGPYLRGTETEWNPLTDDGDALRLAHKLGLLSDVEVWPRTIEDTRRAIVRAAAEIGKEMA